MTDDLKAYAEAVERAERAADELAKATTAEEVEAKEKAFREALAEAERRKAIAGLKRELAEAEPVKTEDPAKLDMDKKEVREYSIVRAIKALIERDRSVAPLEFEASDEIARRMGREPNGLYLPTDVLKRDIDTSAGWGVIAPRLQPQSFIDILRAKMVTRAAGAQFLSGLQGTVALPRRSGAATYYWVSDEGGSLTEDATTAFDRVTLIPKTGGAYVDLTRALLKQSSMDVEALVMNDLATVCALALDYAALHGSGSSGQPTGVASTSGIGIVAIDADGGAPTWEHIVQLETEVAVDNADVGTLAYITNPKVRGKLKNTAKVASTDSVMVWGEGDAPLNGYNAFVTTQVRSDLTKGTGTDLSAIFFGNWSDLILAQWGAIDLTVDPYTAAIAGTVRVVALQDVDVAVRHPESFAAVLDAVTT